MAYGNEEDVMDKAGYNQAARITEILAALRNTFIGAMMKNEFPDSLEACRGTLSVISGKVKEDDINDLNADIYSIEKDLPSAEKTYVHEGGKYFRSAVERTKLKKEIENLWRRLEKLQDEYGYGMLSEEDTGL